MKTFTLTLILTLLTLTGVPVMADDAKPRVLIETNLGNITLELEPDMAPETVANFLAYVDAGHYDGLTFHRCIAKFMIQGGGYDLNFEEKQTRAPIQNEADNGLKNVAGSVAMARTNNPHSATAQFFINVADNTFLDHTSQTPDGWGYAVFGRVVDGMEVVRAIEAVQTTSYGPFDDLPETPIVMSKVARIDQR